jgi:hypothetical protein
MNEISDLIPENINDFDFHCGTASGAISATLAWGNLFVKYSISAE